MRPPAGTQKHVRNVILEMARSTSLSPAIARVSWGISEKGKHLTQVFPYCSPELLWGTHCYRRHMAGRSVRDCE